MFLVLQIKLNPQQINIMGKRERIPWFSENVGFHGAAEADQENTKNTLYCCKTMGRVIWKQLTPFPLLTYSGELHVLGNKNACINGSKNDL